MAAEKPLRTAIVLQGGGSLGAYECGVLKALYDARGAHFQPAVITGISIGAINAALLAGASIQELLDTWRTRFTLLESPPCSPFAAFSPVFGPFIPPAFQQFFAAVGQMLQPLQCLAQPVFEQLLPPVVQQNLSLLGNGGMYRPRAEYLAAGPAAALFTDSLYDTTPLRETLTEKVKIDRLNGESYVVVTAVNVATGQVAQFGNTKIFEDQGNDHEDNPFANQNGLSIDHIVASGSLPPSFPVTKVDGSSYWDGGLYINTPLSIAINCLEKCDQGSPEVQREVIVVELFPMAGDVPTNLRSVVSPSSTLFTPAS